MSTIRVVDLEKRFGKVTAVRKLSLSVGEGEFLTLLGPSGCGKTTTLRMIAGFETPSAGRIYFDDADVTNLPPYRRNIGMVFQSLALFPHMTVAENIAYGLRMRKVPEPEIKRRVESLLRLVRLEGMGERKPGALSGGQRQRVAFARALAINPRILLLDEPFAALDRKLREQLQIELKRLHRQLEVTTIFVTHNQREAFTLSDRIAVVNQGVIEQAGTPQELYYRPRTLFVADFVGEANLFPARLVERSGDLACYELIEEGVQIALRAEGTPPSEAAVMVRPELVKISRSDEGNRGVPARVDLIRFIGELLEVRLLTRGGHEVVATPPLDIARELRVGDEVQLHLSPEHVWVLEGRP